MSVALTEQTVICWEGTPLSSEVDGEIVVMSVENGRYFGLNQPGSDIWKCLEKPISIAQLCQAMGQLYQGDGDQIKADVMTLIGRLLDEELVKVCS